MELIAVIATIAILIALAIPTWSRVRHSLDRQGTVHSLRALGQAISLYAVEHGEHLPGPLWTGNFAYYSVRDDRMIGYHLWPYLELPEPTQQNYEAEILTNPAYLRMRTSDTAQVFVFTDRLQKDGLPFIWHPWGRRDGETLRSSQKLSAVAPYGLGETVAVTELDQLNYPGASAAPPTPPLGDVRMCLYFDWHVAPTEVE